MKISVVTLFPELYTSFLQTSLIGRAQQEGLVSCSLLNLFDFKQDRQRIDAPTYGHGAGMLIRPDVIERAVEHGEQLFGPAYKIFFSPHGRVLDQDLLKHIFRVVSAQADCDPLFAVRQSDALDAVSVEGARANDTAESLPVPDAAKHIMLLPARYEGIDARAESYYADMVVSVGNFVLMGGDLPAMMLIEGLMRLIPGVVGNTGSVEHDSFTGPFVDYPEYTTPVVWKSRTVPEVVRSGNHQQLETWRQKEAVEKTVNSHFEWVRTHALTPVEKKLVLEHIPHHYVALMHSNVMLPEQKEGSTSVTSIDIHDIARSAATYGLKEYFLVTPFADQQKIIMTLLDFWVSKEGFEYNKLRQQAVSMVKVASTLEETVEAIRQKEEKEPLLIGTSARQEEYYRHSRPITYYDQSVVWSEQRPLLFVLGTGHGLAPELLKRCDFMLPPVYGFTAFNHLSVRSAAAVIFDRWLGNDVKTFYSVLRKDCYES